jgi:hypothetical protein
VWKIQENSAEGNQQISAGEMLKISVSLMRKISAKEIQEISVAWQAISRARTEVRKCGEARRTNY